VARWIEAPISLLLVIELQRKIHLKKKKKSKSDFYFPQNLIPHFWQSWDCVSILTSEPEISFKNGQFGGCNAFR
jgi:hypothetical protein